MESERMGALMELKNEEKINLGLEKWV